MPRRKTKTTPAMAKDQVTGCCRINGAVIRIAMSNPRTRLNSRVGGMAPDSVAIMGTAKSTFLPATQRTAPKRPATPVTRAVANPLNRLRSAPVWAMPMNAGVVATAHSSARAAGTAMAEARTRKIDVVQILGSVGAVNSLIDGPDLARVVAAKLGGRHYDLHAPVLVEQEGLRDLLAQEPSVREGLQKARTVSLAITGIGTLHEEAASFLRAGHLVSADLARLRAEGIVGETVGRFFDVQGNSAPYAINDRVIGIDLDDLRAIPRLSLIHISEPTRPY